MPKVKMTLLDKMAKTIKNAKNVGKSGTYRMKAYDEDGFLIKDYTTNDIDDLGGAISHWRTDEYNVPTKQIVEKNGKVVEDLPTMFLKDEYLKRYGVEPLMPWEKNGSWNK